MQQVRRIGGCGSSFSVSAAAFMPPSQRFPMTGYRFSCLRFVKPSPHFINGHSFYLATWYTFWSRSGTNESTEMWQWNAILYTIKFHRFQNYSRSVPPMNCFITNGLNEVIPSTAASITFRNVTILSVVSGICNLRPCPVNQHHIRRVIVGDNRIDQTTV